MKLIKLIWIGCLFLVIQSCSNEPEEFEEFESAQFEIFNPDDPCIQGTANCLPDDGPGDGPGDGSSSGVWPTYHYVHRGDGSTNLYYASSNDGINYTTGQVGLGAQSNEGPSGVIFQNKMFVYYKGRNSNNIFVAYKSNPSSGWSGNTWINSNSKTNKEISAVVHDSKVFIAHRGESNTALYLNYSTNGTSFIQTQALSTGNNVKQFAMTSDGTRIYLFWTKTTDNFQSRVSYTWSDDPTNPNSWQQNIVTNIKDLGNNSIQAQNGLAATVLNGKIHLVWARENDAELPVPPILPSPPERFIQWGVLNSAGDQQLANIRTYLNRETKRRPGVTNNGTNKLIVNFTGNSTDRINTFHISNSNGSEIVNAGETGGEAKVGGVFSFKK